ncbi:hypothetical protein [Collinsella sp. An2]|uniref:hypothetical protein n=1 Tax=Collinsella sp. An2 TaxID=1965585 RepID=UPI000B381CA8|nr:hypothetical protein [Collinsella sp. An2]OUP11063.1 hypothetical protein B5F33_01415 [Collinsella sp. An2]
MGFMDEFKRSAGLDDEKLEKSKERLKGSVKAIGEELKRSGAVLARNAAKSVGDLAEEALANSRQEESRAKPRESVVDCSAATPDLESRSEADDNEAPAKQTMVLPHVDEDEDEPFVTSSEQVSEAAEAEESQPDSVAGSARQESAQKKRATPKLQKKWLYAAAGVSIALIAAIAIGAVACSGGQGGASDSEPDMTEPAEEFDVALHLECERNLFFSTYNLRVLIDDDEQGILAHGDSADYDLELEKGEHQLRLEKEDDPEVAGELAFKVDEDEELYFHAKCTSSGVEVASASQDEIAQIRARNNAKKYLEIANKPGTRADEIIAELEQEGYADEGFELICLDGDERLKDFNPEEYNVESAETDADSKTITLHLVTNIEVSFDQETATRAAVVAMTNCYATDVFTADGSAYDVTKFHSYADMGGYYLTVESSGTWRPKDAQTWHVEGLRLKAAGGDFRIEFKGDVTFDGANYIISGEAKTANSFDAIDSGGENVGTDTFQPSETAPYLTVSPALVADARDTAAESAARDAENAARKEQEDYNDWVSSQFSFWSGSNDAFVDAVKSMLNDERSFHHEETKYLPIRDAETLDSVNSSFSQNGSAVASMNDVLLTMDFTAKNGFNATIKCQAYGIMHYPDGNVDVLGIQ